MQSPTQQPTTNEIMTAKVEPLSNVEIAARAKAAQLCQGCGHPRSEHIEVLTAELDEARQENRTVLLCPQRIFAEKPPYDRKAGTDARALSRI